VSEIFTKEEQAAIGDLARGMTGTLGQATSAYRRVLKKRGVGVRDPFFQFMSEVDNPCPDLGLRARYRAAVLLHTPQDTIGAAPND
jgi:hypothetical protein